MDPRDTHRHANTEAWTLSHSWLLVTGLTLGTIRATKVRSCVLTAAAEGTGLSMAELWLSHTYCTQAASSNLCSAQQMKSIMSYHESTVFSRTGATEKKWFCFPKFKLFVTIWLNPLLKNTTVSVVVLSCGSWGWIQTASCEAGDKFSCLIQHLCSKKSVRDSWCAWLPGLLVLESVQSVERDRKLRGHWRILGCMEDHPSAQTKWPTKERPSHYRGLIHARGHLWQVGEVRTRQGNVLLLPTQWPAPLPHPSHKV